MDRIARIGVVAAQRVPPWQRDAIDRLRAAGAEVVARFAPDAGHGAGAGATVPWDAPPAVPARDASRLDAVFAFAPTRDEAALTAARWGCLRIVLPGDPPAWRAVERGDPTLEIRVERADRDGGTAVLARAVLPVVRTSLTRTRSRMLAEAAELPADALRRLHAGIAPQRLPAMPVERTARLGRLQSAALRARTMRRRIAGMLASLVLHTRWRVGLLRTPLRDLVAGAPVDVDWLNLPAGRFWADPFPLVTRDGVELLCEGYDYARDRGYLARARIAGARVASAPRVLAAPSHHLSYPYVVEDGAQTYVMPEAHQARRVALFTIDDDGLHEAAVLLDDIAAVDPTLVRHEGRWWLFLTDADRDDNGRLLLYHAPALRGPWTPHPLNPVVRDIGCARPAGTPFTVDGTLYRPAQDCSTGYGARVAIARIDVMTPDAYRQTVVAHVAPPRRGPGRRGLHTLAVHEGVALIDGKDLVLDPAATLSVLRSWARRLRGRRDDRPRSRHALGPRPGGVADATVER